MRNNEKRICELAGFSRVLISLQMLIALTLVTSVTDLFSKWTTGLIIIGLMCSLPILNKLSVKFPKLNIPLEIIIVTFTKVFNYGMVIFIMFTFGETISKSVVNPILETDEFVYAIWGFLIVGFLVTGLVKMFFKLSGGIFVSISVITCLVYWYIISDAIYSKLEIAYIVPLVIALYILLNNLKVWEMSIVNLQNDDMVLNLDLYLFKVKDLKYETLNNKGLLYGGVLCTMYNMESVIITIYSFLKQK